MKDRFPPSGLATPHPRQTQQYEDAEEHHITNVIADPSIELRDNDVLSGRGSGVAAHPGNQKFRQLIRSHKNSYVSAPRNQKMAIAAKVIEEIESLNPPGRFLERDGDGSFVTMDYKKALEKTSQALRERPPQSSTRSPLHASHAGHTVVQPIIALDMMGMIGQPIIHHYGHHVAAPSRTSLTDAYLWHQHGLDQRLTRRSEPEDMEMEIDAPDCNPADYQMVSTEIPTMIPNCIGGEESQAPAQVSASVGPPIVDEVICSSTNSETHNTTFGSPIVKEAIDGTGKTVSESIASLPASFVESAARRFNEPIVEHTEIAMTEDEQFEDAVNDPANTSLLVYYQCIQRGYLYGS